jgi:DNA processing protein
LDQNFPKKLLEATNPCVFFFYKGNIKILKNNKFCAVIGSRMLFDSKNEMKYNEEFSNTVLENTQKAATFFSNNGYTIVSGLALGCDTRGHIGSLKSENKQNIAVLCGGLDNIFPKENKQLAGEILANGGILISEDKFKTPVSRYGFISRDSIQAMFADCIIVGYTDYHSGTIYACSEAIKQNKFIIVSKESKFDEEGIKKEKISPQKYLEKYE